MQIHVLMQWLMIGQIMFGDFLLHSKLWKVRWELLIYRWLLCLLAVKASRPAFLKVTVLIFWTVTSPIASLTSSEENYVRKMTDELQLHLTMRIEGCNSSLWPLKACYVHITLISLLVYVTLLKTILHFYLQHY